LLETWIIGLVVTLLVGSAAGFLSGFFGIGGGIILVPAFLWLFGWVDPAAGATIKEAIGTSLILVIPSGLGAVRKQIAIGNLDLKLCVRWAIYIAIGAACGISLSALFHPAVLKTIFMAYLLLCVIIMLVLKSNPKKADGFPGQQGQIWGGVVIGALSVLLGVGGGTFVTPYFRLYGCRLKKAIGISSATTIVIGVVGAVGMIVTGWNAPGRVPYSLGYVSVIAAVLVAPLMFWLSPYGVTVAQRLSRAWLKALYVIFLMLLFGYMVWHTY
jgi:uncharacterized membrane protein YfcA